MSVYVSTIMVPNDHALRNEIDSFIAMGYDVATQDAVSATMVKRKKFSVAWAVVGFFLCFLPLLVYLLVYACTSNTMVRIAIQGSHPAVPLVHMSPDGQWWWSTEQNRWVGMLEQAPVSAIGHANGQT